MEALIKLVGKEWALISGAPVTIALLIVLVFVVVHLLYKERLKSANELIALRDKRIQDFKDNTGTASLEEAAERINGLEKRFQELDELDLVAKYEEAKLDIGKLPPLP